MIEERKENRGITLIALVVTIVVLIILAGISISALTGDNGIITQAKEAKEKTEIAEEQEIVNISAIQACGEDKFGEIIESNLKVALDNNIGEEKYILNADDNYFRVTYKDSKRTYLIDKDGNVTSDDTPKVSDKYPGDITDNGKWDGSEEKPYRITSVEDYVEFIRLTRVAEYQQASFTLGEDLDFFSPNSYVDPETQMFGDYNRDGKTEGLLKEICNTSERGLENGLRLYGTFDGNGHILNNFYMKDELGIKDDSMTGMFHNNYGTIKNLNLKGKIILDEIPGEFNEVELGVIAARNNDTGKITNCTTEVNMIVKDTNIELSQALRLRIGGIAGYNSGIINDCEYKGKINSYLIVNSNLDATHVTDVLIGGVVGNNKNIVMNCINKGNINSYYEFYTTVGASNEQISTGGIAGKNNDTGIIENCINIGSVQSKTPTSEIRIAGISSESENLETCIFSNVYNAGKIIAETTSELNIGGVLAEGYGILNYAYNIGGIEVIGVPSSKNVGAIIGNYASSTTPLNTQNCYFNKVSGLYAEENGEHQDEIEGLMTEVENLTEEKVIEYLNNNVDTNNASSERIWKKVQYVNGEVSF